jgi:hypothetical protein
MLLVYFMAFHNASLKKKCIIAATVICAMLWMPMCTMHMLDCLLYAELELMYGIIFEKSRNIYQQ